MDPANPFEPPLASPPNRNEEADSDDRRGRRPVLRLLPVTLCSLLSALCLIEALWAAGELAIAASRGPSDAETWGRLVRDACRGVPLFLASGAVLLLAARTWYAWRIRRALALTAVGGAAVGMIGPALGLTF